MFISLCALRLCGRSCLFIDSQIFPDSDLLGPELFRQNRSPFHGRPFGTAKNIQARRLEFGKSVDGQVGLLEKPESGQSPCIRKLMPDAVSQGLQSHRRDDFLKKTGQTGAAPQSFLRTSINFQQPFNSCQKRSPRYSPMEENLQVDLSRGGFETRPYLCGCGN